MSVVSVWRQHGERDGGAGVLDERHDLGVRHVADGHVVDGHDGVAHVQVAAARRRRVGD